GQAIGDECHLCGDWCGCQRSHGDGNGLVGDDFRHGKHDSQLCHEYAGRRGLMADDYRASMKTDEGFTLVELLMASLLTVLILSVAYGIFQSASATARSIGYR